MSEYYNRHNRLALACPVSNLSPVFGPSIKREIGIREAITEQHEKRLPISYLALKTQMLLYQQNTHKVEVKSLYFNLVYVFLFSAKTRIYKQNTRTYTQNGGENSLFQFCLTITEPFSPFYLEEMSLSISRASPPMNTNGGLAWYMAHRYTGQYLHFKSTNKQIC